MISQLKNILARDFKQAIVFLSVKCSFQILKFILRFYCLTQQHLKSILPEKKFKQSVMLNQIWFSTKTTCLSNSGQFEFIVVRLQALFSSKNITRVFTFACEITKKNHILVNVSIST